MSQPRLYEVMPITTPKSTWLLNILSPLVCACKMPPIAIEIRPLDCAGRCVYSERDKRVQLSKKIVFWGHATVARIYLHECAHRLLEDENVDGHGVEFFTLLLVLHTRAKSHLSDLGAGNEPLKQLDFYDCSEKSRVWQTFNIEPADWMSTQIQWSIDVAPALADSTDDATVIAEKITRMWRENVKNLRTNLEQEAAHKRQHDDEILGLRNQISIYKVTAVACIFSIFLLVSGVLLESAR